MEENQITIQDEKYWNLVEECKSIIVETLFNSRIEILKGKWLLGKRITEEELNFEKGVYGEKTIQILAQDLEISQSHLYKILQFYKKFQLENFEKVLEVLPEGKNISWFKICQNVLPKPPEEIEKEEKIKKEQEECPHTQFVCVNCKKKFTIEEILNLYKEK